MKIPIKRILLESQIHINDLDKKVGYQQSNKILSNLHQQKFGSTLNDDIINDWRSELKEQRVDVFMPKFTFDTKYFMNETLAKMGMPTAFTYDADLSGMDGTQNLFIQKVIP